MSVICSLCQLPGSHRHLDGERIPADIWQSMLALRQASLREGREIIKMGKWRKKIKCVF